MKGLQSPLPALHRPLCSGTAGQGFHTIVLLPLFPLRWAECLIWFIVVGVISGLCSMLGSQDFSFLSSYISSW